MMNKINVVYISHDINFEHFLMYTIYTHNINILYIYMYMWGVGGYWCIYKDYLAFPFAVQVVPMKS